MNKQAAINLVQTTFEHPYNRDRFLSFAKNIFHSFEDAPFIYRGNYIPDAYKKQIKTLERIGKYEDKEGNKIDILAVCVSQGTTLERARTLQRNFISWYLNGSRGDVTKDAALVAFYVEGSNDWRLSLVKMEYRLDKSESGRLKTFTELTPAKRFSFFVGEGENTHTAQRQLMPVLLREDAPPTLSDLEKAFSVEVVTKEFFEKYKQLFLDTKEALDKIVKVDPQIQSDFQDKNIDTVDFTKKLLGQIVFLYFLQKKGWFGVARDDIWGSGPKEFLRLLFKKSIVDYDNFFNDILEPLFYEALAIERPDDFYSRFNCKIPFLNGGLFDPLNNYDWVHTDIHLPNYLFSNDKLTKEGDKGTGILDVFDRYNFTVKEDEPLEKEVAVDPEMLGKVFENLLEVKDRKSKGTYYTPREIVHYMCQESLVNYLVTELDGKVNKEDIETLIQIGEAAVEHDTQVTRLGEETETYSYKLPASVRQNAKAIDEALVNIRVCDPAVGSGAFLVGMMTEIIRVRNTISSYLTDGDRSIYTFKHHAIQNSLYGVDIDPGATEIAKLRLWLSLIVDEQDIKRIKPLPNLDYKIMQGNSLLEEYEGIKLFDEELFTKSAFDNTVQVADIKGKMSELQREFFELHSKGEYRSSKMQQIEAELKRYSNTLKKMTQPPKVKAENTGLFDQMSEAKQKADELKRLQKEFFNTAHKKEKDRIKKQIEALTWEFIEATLREQGKESLTREIEKFKKTNIKPFFLWKLNFSEVFESKGGFDVVVANPPYVDSETMTRNESDTRRIYSQIYASAKGNWDLFVIFIEKGTLLLSEKGVISYIVPNKLIGAKYTETLRELLLTKTIKEIRDYSEVNVFKDVAVYPVVFVIQNTAKREKVEVVKMLSIEEAYQSNEIKPEVFYDDIYWDKYLVGAKYLQIVLKISDNKRLSEYCENIIGAATVSEAYEIKKIIKEENQPIEGKYKKLINTGTIDPYVSLWGKQKTQYLKDGYVKPIILDEELIKKYPTRYKQAASNKIVIGGMTKRLEAFFDKGNYLAGKSTTIILESPKIDIYFLLALLNSELVSFWYKIYFRSLSLAGGYLRINSNEIKKIPVCELKDPLCQQIVSIVQDALSVTGSEGYFENPQKRQEVQGQIKQIDQLVCELYRLTPEEIDVIKSYERNK